MRPLDWTLGLDDGATLRRKVGWFHGVLKTIEIQPKLKNNINVFSLFQNSKKDYWPETLFFFSWDFSDYTP